MEKRGRGRPRKNASHNFRDQERMNSSNKKVTSSDILPEFFKICMPGLYSEMMAIPPDFIDKFGGNIPTTCTLKKPSGVSWQVDMKRTNDCWLFQKGWPEFVQQNSIKDHDVLVFCLVGNSTFSVTIFTPNGCTKGEEAAEDTSESEDSEISGTSQRIVGRKMGSVGNISGNPYFRVKMQRSHIDKGVLHLPAQFWSKFMKKKGDNSKMVTLKVKNAEWGVELVTKYHDRVLLGRGFVQFVKDNSLKFGTLCTFELIHTNPFSFQVTIQK